MPGQLQFAFGLGISAFMLFAGGTLVLMAVGVVQPDEPAGWGGRILALLFGGGIAYWGGWLILMPLRTMAAAEGAHDWLGAARLGLARLVLRVDVQSFLAAITLVPLVLGYWREVRGGAWWGPSRETLIGLVPIEFLLIHGFPFLAVAATFARIPDRWPRWGGRIAVGAFLLLYSLFAWGVFEGPSGVVALLYLSLPNVLAFAHGMNDWTVRTTAVARWATKLIAFIGVAMLLNERSIGGPGALPLGLYYFTIQTLLELFRVADLPLDLGEAWARLPAEQRKSSQLSAFSNQ